MNISKHGTCLKYKPEVAIRQQQAKFAQDEIKF